jgi:hypothetical protein
MHLVFGEEFEKKYLDVDAELETVDGGDAALTALVGAVDDGD